MTNSSVGRQTGTDQNDGGCDRGNTGRGDRAWIGKPLEATKGFLQVGQGGSHGWLPGKAEDLRVRQEDPPVQRLGGVKGQDAVRVWK